MSEFLTRPLGGLELETFIALAELWCGAWLIMQSGTSVWSSDALRSFYDVIPGFVLALPFLISATLSLVGVALFFRGDHLCAPLRWYGSLISAALWTWIFVKAAVVTGGDMMPLGFYFLAIFAAGRANLAAWHRW